MRKTAYMAILFALFVSAATVPAASATSIPKVLSGSSKLTAQTDAAAKTTTPTKQPNNQPAPAPDVVVTVQAGDTLIALASAQHTTYQRLFNANDSIVDPNVINPGQQLRVPKDDEQLPDRMSALPQATQQSVAAAAQTYAATTRSTSVGSYPALAGNAAKAFIYSHESGNNPSSTNPHGCYGLGQDCNGRVQAQCGADYACQDAYFTGYATSRYGGWDQAAAFWQANGWW